MVSIKKFFVEKRWALIAILTGVFFGFGSAVFCIAGNLVIFGFNIMYILSPLLAGFAETFIARRRYGKSTGAISALLTFILINGYGWFSPGFIFPKEPATLSLITIIAIILTLQAAFPTLINYILLVTSIGIFRKFIEFMVFLPSRLMRRPPKVEEEEEKNEPPVFDNLQNEVLCSKHDAFESFLNELTEPILSVPQEELKIKKYVGIVTGEAVAKEEESEGRLSMLTNIIEPTQLEDLNLGEARKEAVSKMLDNAKSLGANNVIEVLIDYVSMGGLQGSALIVTATGTAVIDQYGTIELEENTSKDNKAITSEDKKILGENEKNNDYNSPIYDKRHIVKQIIGKEVIDSSASLVGKVKDVEVNFENNEIEAIILGKNNISESLGLSREEIIIPFDAIVQIGDRILIKKIDTDESYTRDYYSYLERKIRDI